MIQIIIFSILLISIMGTFITELIIGMLWILKIRKKAPLNNIVLKLKRNTVILGSLFILILILIIFSYFSTDTPIIVDKNGNPLPKSIAELRKVQLNGRQEWISIRGENKNNPVLLFLAGGPGGTQMAAVRYNLQKLEKNFVVVNWDQPGSGKSYYAANVKNLNVNTYVQDGYALTKYLCKTFKKDKIYLVGESWGSALGIFLSEKYPEKYYSFVGTGQMVDFSKTEELDYENAIKIAQIKNNTNKITKLRSNGHPPYYGTDVTWKSAEYLNYLSSYMQKDPGIYNSHFNTWRDISSSEYNLVDKINFLWGLTNTFNHVYPQLYSIDLRKNYAKVKIPIYFFIGRRDINAPISLVEDYYNVLRAPHKEIVWFEHSGHSPWINESDKFVNQLNKILIDK
ncbi:proline iminopeptidase [Clostridium coskatii]|uniref:prolyl aminopeptidase n=2 Tax=Clostridium coskatii TaxID=1705578 RepID=A0A166UNR0_9CLOT|nr:Proline iminopeptidase [Clostridium coskatii]OBR97555.1 proline iminopeptidase [Clostridium coskatii]